MNPTIEETIKKQLKSRKNAHFMLVDGMSKLMTHEVRWFQSSVFHVSGLKWKLLVSPSKKDGTLGFYLEIQVEKSLPYNWEVACCFELSVVSQTKYVHDICKPFVVGYNANKNMEGYYNFIMQTKTWRDIYIVNDKAVFCAEITVVKPNFPVTNIPRTMGTAIRHKLMEEPPKNSRFTWKITRFSSFDGEKHYSYEFTFGPRIWKLEMNPKRYGEGKENSLSLYLHASDYVTNAPKEETFASINCEF